MNFDSRDRLWIYLSGTAILVISLWIYLGYFRPEWKDYQSDFREVVAKRFGPDRAREIPSGIQQVWAKDLNRVDRCVTCHLSAEWKGLENAPEPFKSHPREILTKHPVSKYGCTICHGGQGYATDTETAHATTIEHWEEPLLGKELTASYSVSDRKALMQINCNICHRYDAQTPGADFINDAKQLVKQKGCRACHTINGRGGVIGPDLSYVGDKSTEQYDYSHLLGVKSVFAWHVAHLKNPKSMSPESVMPTFGFDSHQAQSLAMLVMSWKRSDLPIAYIPGMALGDKPTPEEIAKDQQMQTGEGAFFAKKTCFICHDVSTLGIESATKIGPDLANAYADVQARFGRTLEDFLASPTGTMAMVLSTQIHLTDAEKQEAIAKLKIAYQKKLEQDAKAAQAKK